MQMSVECHECWQKDFILLTLNFALTETAIIFAQ